MSAHPIPSPLTDDLGTDPTDDDLPTFTPARARRDGWTPDRQRAFLAALRRTGQTAVAARAVGMSHQSARVLRARPHAQSFGAAWDLMLDEDRGEALADAIERATTGALVPRYYRGRFVRMERRHDDRALLAALRVSFARAPGS